VTLLFADVRGFSKISENLTAEELIRFVNRLFTPLTETILAHGGTIDKFMGDAVMAFWNAPLRDSEHAANACRAALAMLANVSQLNAELREEALRSTTSFIPVRIGIGLNTGECVVGNVGSPQRFDYSVLGDVVNVAARFEEATKAFGTDIIVGQRTAAAAPRFALLELGAVTPRGKDRPERMLALLGDENFANSDLFQQLKEAHATLLAAGRAGDQRGLEDALKKCRTLAVPGITAYYQNYSVEPDAVRIGGGGPRSSMPQDV
jgi:adenylate cyclase